MSSSSLSSSSSPALLPPPASPPSLRLLAMSQADSATKRTYVLAVCKQLRVKRRELEQQILLERMELNPDQGTVFYQMNSWLRGKMDDNLVVERGLLKWATRVDPGPSSSQLAPQPPPPPSRRPPRQHKQQQQQQEAMKKKRSKSLLVAPLPLSPPPRNVKRVRFEEEEEEEEAAPTWKELLQDEDDEDEDDDASRFLDDLLPMPSPSWLAVHRTNSLHTPSSSRGARGDLFEGWIDSLEDDDGTAAPEEEEEE